MITIRDLAQRLRAFANESPENGLMEVMVVHNDEVALQFGKADTHTTMGSDGKVRNFLVFFADPKSKIVLGLKKKELINDTGTSH